ncbi:MAG: hypothetical protein FWE61_07765 [Micrococcales bacterium]|nr:hypothetical protein [Micrococcales bacterium]
MADSSLDRRTNVADQRTVSNLRTARDVAGAVRLYHGQMRDEPVLWAADVLAWAARRSIALDDTRWLALLDPVLTVLEARSGHVLKTQQPQAAVATPGVRQPDGEVPREPAAVAGATFPSTVDGWEAHVFDRGTTVLDSLARQATEIRRALGARGVVAGNSPSAVERRARRRSETGSAEPG